MGADEDTGKAVATALEALYTDPATAPHGWWEKDGLRRELRQKARAMAYDHGLKDPTLLKEIPEQIERFALKHMRGA